MYCKLMDELQQTDSELQQYQALIKMVLNSCSLTYSICSMSGTFNAFYHFQQYEADEVYDEVKHFDLTKRSCDQLLYSTLYTE